MFTILTSPFLRNRELTLLVSFTKCVTIGYKILYTSRNITRTFINTICMYVKMWVLSSDRHQPTTSLLTQLTNYFERVQRLIVKEPSGIQNAQSSNPREFLQKFPTWKVDPLYVWIIINNRRFWSCLITNHILDKWLDYYAGSELLAEFLVVRVRVRVRVGVRLKVIDSNCVCNHSRM